MIEKGESFDVIYTDFAKAFDSVAHERLIVKIGSLGFKGDILEWIKSFLKNRKQCVNVAGKLSQWNEVLSFSQRIVNSWNSLPPYVINAHSINEFKNRLDRLELFTLRN